MAVRYLAALTVALVAAVPPPVHAQDAIADALASVYQRYRAIDSTPDIATLVQLDRELRALLQSMRDEHVSITYLKPAYAVLGIEPTLFEGGTLTYTGKLLYEAHRTNPRSAYRRYTLFSTIQPGGGNVNSPPSPRAAESYLSEFPDGPFAIEAVRLLAFFYDDLHKVIRSVIEGDVTEYKYECYKRFLSPNAKEQLPIARRSAIRYYRQALAAQPTDENLTSFLADIERGENHAWFFCGD